MRSRLGCRCNRFGCRCSRLRCCGSNSASAVGSACGFLFRNRGCEIVAYRRAIGMYYRLRTFRNCRSREIMGYRLAIYTDIPGRGCRRRCLYRRRSRRGSRNGCRFCNRGRYRCCRDLDFLAAAGAELAGIRNLRAAVGTEFHNLSSLLSISGELPKILHLRPLP